MQFNTVNTYIHSVTRAHARTRAGMRTRTGTETRTRLKKRVEGRESQGTLEAGVIEVGWKAEEGGRHERVTSNHTRKT